MSQNCRYFFSVFFFSIVWKCCTNHESIVIVFQNVESLADWTWELCVVDERVFARFHCKMYWGRFYDSNAWQGQDKTLQQLRRDLESKPSVLSRRYILLFIKICVVFSFYNHLHQLIHIQLYGIFSSGVFKVDYPWHMSGLVLMELVINGRCLSPLCQQFPEPQRITPFNTRSAAVDENVLIQTIAVNSI